MNKMDSVGQGRSPRWDALALLIVLLVGGVVLIVEGYSFTGQLSYVATGSSTGTPDLQIATGSTYTAWSMSLSNTAREMWNVSLTWTTQGNDTIIIEDANMGTIYMRESDYLQGYGTATTGHYFDLLPGSSHRLELLIINDNANPQILTNSSVKFTEWSYPALTLGQDLIYLGFIALIAGVLVSLWAGMFFKRAAKAPPVGPGSS